MNKSENCSFCIRTPSLKCYIAMLLSLTGLDFMSSISGSATAISNVGPGLGKIIGPNGNFKEISDPAIWILAFGMILGRLELFAVLVFK